MILSTLRAMAIFGLCFVSTWSQAQDAAGKSFEQSVRPFLTAYCIECHGPNKPKADFRVDQLKLSATAADAESWQLVLDNLHLGEMPPAKAKQPKPTEVEPVTAWIQGDLKRAALALGGQKNEVVLRRLNRLEYENTIEDLFDVRGDYAVGFPEDAARGGFNTNGAALSLSAEQLTQYLHAADFILNRAIVTTPRPQTKLVRFTLEDIEEQKRKRLKNPGPKSQDKTPRVTKTEVERQKRDAAEGRTGGPYFPRYGEDNLIAVKYSRPDTNGFLTVREPGWYRFAVTAYPVRNDGRLMRLEVSHGSGKKEEVPTIVDVIQMKEPKPQRHEYRLYLQPGHRVELAMLDGTNWLPGSKIQGDTSPAIAVKSIEVEGPIIEHWPPRGHQAIIGTVDAANLKDSDVPLLLMAFAPQLYRRPVDAGVMKEFVGFYQARRAEVPPLEACKLTLKAMLASPLFLYHYEPKGKLDDYALANRMSYFLWRSMPDTELFALAAKGKLSQPDELKRQALRLLANPKADRFHKDFVGQWLDVSKVGDMQPDKGLYPEYDEELERAMAKETELFIREMLVNDLNVANLIDSDWTMLNDRLARHYGIPGVEGNQFRKVVLDKSKTVRGGLLTQASILSVTSNGTTTSPVVRGVWVLDRLLGTPSPPPPPDVPPLEPGIRGASTIQEQLAKHRTIAQCAACHQKIDPYGMSLENFDVIGRWRENYRALVSHKSRPRPQLEKGKPVSSADQLPRLGAFKDFVEFRDLLKKNESLVFHNVAEKLSMYSLGRGLGFIDRPDLDAIVTATRANGGGLRTMVLALIQSPASNFPTRRYSRHRSTACSRTGGATPSSRASSASGSA